MIFLFKLSASAVFGCDRFDPSASSAAAAASASPVVGEWIVSLADITPAGLLMLHANVEQGGAFCAGYRSRWTKEPWRHDSAAGDIEGTGGNKGGAWGVEPTGGGVAAPPAASTTKATCRGVSIDVLSPRLGAIYPSDSPLDLSVNVTACDEPPSSASSSAFEFCMVVDDGREMCAGVNAATGFVTLELDGLNIGTHSMSARLVGSSSRGTIREILEEKPAIVFDVVPTLDEQKESKPLATSAPVRQRAPPPSSAVTTAPIKVAVLAINLGANSQTDIFERFALGLPRPAFDVHFFAPTRSFRPSAAASEAETAARLARGLVPLHAVLDYGSLEGINSRALEVDAAVAEYLRSVTRADELLLQHQPLSEQITEQPLPSLELRRILHSFVSDLQSFDVATIANSRGVPTTEVFAECARLAARPRVVLELPNLFPDPSRLAAAVDAIVAPSNYALQHPSVRGFVERMQQEDPRRSRRALEQVIYPAALPPSGPLLSTAATTPTAATATAITTTVAFIGRLAPERSPGILLHTVAALGSSMAAEQSSGQRRRLVVLIAGDGALREVLESELSPLLLRPNQQPQGVDLSVEWLGPLAHADIPDRVLRRADVVVNTRLDGETFGVGNAEAAAAGVPTVAFARGANSESVLSFGGVHCGRLVVAPFTPQRLADAVLATLQERHAPHSSFDAQRCAAQARDAFGAQRFLEAYSRFYRDCHSDIAAVEGAGAAAVVAARGEPGSATPSLPIGVLRVVVSGGAMYLSPLLGKLLPKAFPTMHVDWGGGSTGGRAPVTATLVVASALDGGCRDEWGEACREALRAIIGAGCDGGRCLVAVAVGEAWDMRGIVGAVSSTAAAGSVVLLHGTADPSLLPDEVPSLHLPVAASSFGERAAASPLSLLSPTLGNQHYGAWREGKPRFAAHLYFRCDRAEREQFFDALQQAAGNGLAVDALGHCGGASASSSPKPPNEQQQQRFQDYAARRFATSWHDDSVAQYGPHRFVVAFENNNNSEGYVTEKIINAWLAGSIPIYRGPRVAATAIFNPNSFVNCGDFRSLSACAEHVVSLDSDPVAMSAMLSEPPVKSKADLGRFFSWIEGVDGHEELAARFRLSF